MNFNENTITTNPNSIFFKIKDEDMSQDSTKKSDTNFNTTENQFKNLKIKFVSKAMKKKKGISKKKTFDIKNILGFIRRL